MFSNLTVPVIPYLPYKRQRRFAAKEIRLNAYDIDKCSVPSKGILFLDHVPKPINLLERHRSEVTRLFKIREE